MKLISKGGKKKKAANLELYDLENDPSEQKNVIKQNPEVAKDMQKQLEYIIKLDKGIRK